MSAAARDLARIDVERLSLRPVRHRTPPCAQPLSGVRLSSRAPKGRAQVSIGLGADVLAELGIKPHERIMVLIDETGAPPFVIVIRRARRGEADSLAMPGPAKKRASATLALTSGAARGVVIPPRRQPHRMIRDGVLLILADPDLGAAFAAIGAQPLKEAAE